MVAENSMVVRFLAQLRTIISNSSVNPTSKSRSASSRIKTCRQPHQSDPCHAMYTPRWSASQNYACFECGQRDGLGWPRQRLVVYAAPAPAVAEACLWHCQICSRMQPPTSDTEPEGDICELCEPLCHAAHLKGKLTSRQEDQHSCLCLVITVSKRCMSYLRYTLRSKEKSLQHWQHKSSRFTTSGCGTSTNVLAQQTNRDGASLDIGRSDKPKLADRLVMTG